MTPLQQRAIELIQSLPNPSRLKNVTLNIQWHQPIDQSHIAIWILGMMFVAVVIVAICTTVYNLKR